MVLKNKIHFAVGFFFWIFYFQNYWLCTFFSNIIHLIFNALWHGYKNQKSTSKLHPELVWTHGDNGCLWRLLNVYTKNCYLQTVIIKSFIKNSSSFLFVYLTFCLFCHKEISPGNLLLGSNLYKKNRQKHNIIYHKSAENVKYFYFYKAYGVQKN